MSYNREKLFFEKLVENIRDDIYMPEDNKIFLTLSQQITKTNDELEIKFTIPELAKIYTNLVDMVTYFTNNTGQNICAGVITIAEYFEDPEIFL